MQWHFAMTNCIIDARSNTGVNALNLKKMSGIRSILARAEIDFVVFLLIVVLFQKSRKQIVPELTPLGHVLCPDASFTGAGSKVNVLPLGRLVGGP
jgi:hypothetical protein